MLLFLYIAAILLGFGLLMKGGDYLVEGSVNIARRLRLSSMVIGLTVVGFGTSMPELLVSVQSALEGKSGIAIGNVVGSNIANIGLILGITGLMVGIPVSCRTIKRDFPFMLLSVVLLTLVGCFGDGTIHRWQGLVGLLMLLFFVCWQVFQSRKNPDPNSEKSLANFRQYGIGKALLVVLLSFLALVAGAKVLIYGASEIARQIGEALGVDTLETERIIGLTIVAVGTSLPELFATVMAARRGQTDMALGNIIGSVTFNILSVIGLAATICPIAHARDPFIVDYLIMTCICLLLFLLVFSYRHLHRVQGIILLLLYIAYLVYTCRL